MSRSPHEAPIPKKGRVLLRDGELIFERDDGQEFGRVYVGPDGAVYNGGEVGIAQKGDPAALNLISTADQPMSGKLSFQHLRSDGRGIEVAYIGGGRTEDSSPGAMRGQIGVFVANGQEGQREMAFVATSHGTPGRVWSGLKNFAGWMWKFASAGDSGPYSAAGGALSTGWPSRFQSDRGRFVYNVQDDEASGPAGRIVVYDTWDATGARIADEGQWQAVGVIAPQAV